MNKTVWSAKVHTSGTKIQLIKNGSVTKVIKASDSTFSPDKAQNFAKTLVAKLNDKVAKQMVNPDGKVSVETKAEEQATALKSVEQDAKGISPKQAAAIVEENKSLKRKIAKIEKDAAIERKARRGLAIAKSLVEQKKIANNEQAIKSQVMKIVAMSNDEISLLEKKAAGLPLYNSIEDAALASRRYARMARLHKQAAEDAQLAGDEQLADDEDIRASRYEDLAKEATSFTTEDASEKVDDEAEGADAQGKSASDDDFDVDENADEAAFENDDSSDNELIEGDVNDDDDDDNFEVEAAAAIYKKIASDHRAKSVELRKAGKTAEADVEDEIADESEQLASCVDSDDEVDNDDEVTKQAACIYRKIASDHRAKADEFEAAGKTAEADVEDEIADEAEQLAATVEGSCKTADESEELDKVDEAGTEETPNEETPTAVPEVPAENKEATKPEEAETTEEVSNLDKDAEKKEDTKEEDPLAALMESGEKEAGEEEDIDLGDVPSDDLVTAALAEDSNEDEEEQPVEDITAGVEEVETNKEASGEKKVANEGYNHKVASDRLEHNSAACDPQVKEITDMLWGK